MGVILGCLLVAGCAMPPLLTYGSLAADGIIYIATGKGVGDHALSMITHKDCAMWRLFKEQAFNAVCRDAGYGGDIVVAVRENAMGEPYIPEPAPADRWETPFGGAFFSAAATPEPGFKPGPRKAVRTPSMSAAMDTALRRPPVAGYVGEVGAVARWATPVRTPPVPDRGPVALAAIRGPHFTEPSASSFLVVGSFHGKERAERLAASLGGEPADVVAARVDGADFYRVVVGPYGDDGIAAARGRLADFGLSEVWRLDRCTAWPDAAGCAGAAD